MRKLKLSLGLVPLRDLVRKPGLQTQQPLLLSITSMQPGQVMEPHTQKSQCLVLMLCGHHLEILNTSEPRALHLLLALGPANPIAGPAHNSMDAPLFLHPGPRNARHVWDSTAPSSWNPSALLALPSGFAGFQALSATQEHWQLLLGCFSSCRINEYPTLINSSKSKLSKMSLIKTRGSWVFSDSMQ